MNTSWQEKIKKLYHLLQKLEIIDGSGRVIEPDRAFVLLLDLTLAVKHHERTVYVVGNGASASMASHFAADLAKNGQLHTQVFSDLALITAISNDLGYEHVFSEPLRRRGQKGDLLVVISSSGQSPNLLEAVKTARTLGMGIVTLSAMNSDNSLRRLGDWNIYLPATSYGEAETTHAAILHYWIDLVTGSGNEQ